jgi:hypothetical protein
VVGEKVVRGLGYESLDGGVALGGEQLERPTGLARCDSWPRISGADLAGRAPLTSCRGASRQRGFRAHPRTFSTGKTAALSGLVR